MSALLVGIFRTFDNSCPVFSRESTGIIASVAFPCVMNLIISGTDTTQFRVDRYSYRSDYRTHEKGDIGKLHRG